MAYVPGRCVAPLRHAAAALALLGLVAGAPPGLAQSDSEANLAERVSQLEERVNGLAEALKSGDLGEGEQGEQVAAQLQVRLTELEQSVREMTGQFEEVRHRVDRVRQRLDTLIGDVDYRLNEVESQLEQTRQRLDALEAGEPTAPSEPQAAGSESGQNGGAKTADAGESGGSAGTGNGESAGGPNGSASTNETSSEGGKGADSGDLIASLPKDDPQAFYKAGFNRLSQQDYDAAETIFTAFLERYQDHDLADNAKYWLGETYYVRRSYSRAAVTFAEGYQNYRDGGKAPDNLLKLGLSLVALERPKDACVAFEELQAEFPEAQERLRQRAQREASELDCATVLEDVDSGEGPVGEGAADGESG